jgi:predicted RNA-binding protein YlqC (UPF0109 family)
MLALLDFVVKGLVDQPEAVSVTPVDRNGLTLYELRVAPSDVGKIIGKQGATIHALRTLLQVASAHQGQRCALEIVEDSPAKAP